MAHRGTPERTSVKVPAVSVQYRTRFDDPIEGESSDNATMFEVGEIGLSRTVQICR